MMSSSRDAHTANKLCLVCGDKFTKAALPSHYKQCVSKYVGKPSKLEPTIYSLDTVVREPVIKHVKKRDYRPDIKSVPVKEVKAVKAGNQHDIDHETFDRAPSRNQNETVDRSQSRTQNEYPRQEIVKQRPTSSKKQPKPVISAETFDDIPLHAPTDENLPSEFPEEYVEMHPCKICNRKFNNTERLDKHMTVCEKASKPRRTFDASKARVKGTELEQFAGKKKVEPVIKKSNWREKREGFLKMVRSAKDPGQNSEPVENPDYIMCEFCERKFNEIAAARHIPICKESKLKQQMRMGFSTKSSPVKDDERKKRLAFKAPLPKGKSPK